MALRRFLVAVLALFALTGSGVVMAGASAHAVGAPAKAHCVEMPMAMHKPGGEPHKAPMVDCMISCAAIAPLAPQAPMLIEAIWVAPGISAQEPLAGISLPLHTPPPRFD